MKDEMSVANEKKKILAIRNMKTLILKSLACTYQTYDK